MANLQLAGVRKAFGANTILHGIDLEIADGEFIVFVGPSGCGKSTLLRAICGLDDVDGGEIHIGGRRMNGVPPAERGLAMVFQSYALYPHMTVRENMAFALELAGRPKAEIEAAVTKAAQALRIEALLGRRPKELSGGQRQRVAIGRAIVRQPSVFLFDEPLSNLDAALRVQMRIELARLHRDLATTMIYVTHDQVEAMTLADRIVVFNGGRIEQVGPPLQLYHEPDNLFVAGFLGAPTMNFLAGEVHESDGQRAAIAVAQKQAMVDVALAAPPARGQRVTVGIRPEHLVTDAAGGIPATVFAVEHLGDGAYLYASVAGSGEQVVVRAAPEADWRAGQTLSLGAAPGRIHVFGEDGKRLRPLA
jgi:multiple sugar transport system ATP-binding protein